VPYHPRSPTRKAYRSFLSTEALHDLGASDDVNTWLPTFVRKESVIAEQIRRLQRAAPDAPAIVASINARCIRGDVDAEG